MKSVIKNLKVVCASGLLLAAVNASAATPKMSRRAKPAEGTTSTVTTKAAKAQVGALVSSLASAAVSGASISALSRANVQANLIEAIQQDSRLFTTYQKVATEITNIAATNGADANRKIEALSSVLYAIAGLKDAKFTIVGKDVVPSGLANDEEKQDVSTIIELVLGNVILNSATGQRNARVTNPALLERAVSVLSDFASDKEKLISLAESADNALDKNGYDEQATVTALNGACGIQ